MQESAVMGAAVASLTTDIVFVVDPSTLRLCHANRAFSLQLGYEPEEVVRLSVFDVVAAERSDIEEKLRELASAGEVYVPVRSFRTKSGQILEVEVRIGASQVDGRSLYCVIARDLSKIRNTEALLRESEERFKTLAEVSFEAIVFTEAGRIVDVNRQATELLGAPAERLVGRPVSDFVAPEDRERVARSLRSGVSGPYEHMVLRADGSPFPAEVHARSITQGKRSLRVTTLRDISVRRNLEEQVRLAQRMDSVGRLARGIAHDFNNLLTVILSVTRLLADRSQNPADADDFAEVTRAAGRASELTQQLLAFARRQIVHPEVLDVNQQVMAVEKMLRRVIGDDVRLVTSLSSELGHVRADAGQVEQVLMNLALNARDAMKHGGTLTLETANVALDEEYSARHPEVTPGDFVMMSVSDTGVGMDEKLMSQIFEPFFTTKEAGKGTGLGLATCYGIVKQSGGTIWIYSELGKGTTVKVYLPRVWDAVQERVQPPPEVATGGSETLLVVEDNEMVRRLAVRVLQARGYKVLQAGDGDEALRVYRTSGRVDLLITDVVLPTMSGKDLAESLLGLQRGIKVLYTSGYTEDTIVHQGVVDPKVDFLAKPYVPSDLLRSVRQALGDDR
jgi:PAS domain S-box-containing protein